MKLNYKHLVQKPSLCAPTCLQMIFLRRDIWVEQEEIAKEIGIKIPESESESFYISLPIGKTKEEFGISLIDFKNNKVKEFLNKHVPSLKATVYFISKIDDVIKFISNNLEKGNDVIANFWLKHFKKELDIGHFSLISEIDGDEITICDPWPENKSFWKTEVNELTKAMSDAFDGKERGFVVFSR